MRSRLLGVRTIQALVLTSAVGLTSAACTAGDNGPLDPNASAALPMVSAPNHLTAASSSASAKPAVAQVTRVTKHPTSTQPIRTFAAKTCHDTVFAQVAGNQQYGFTAGGSAPHSRIYGGVGDGLRWKLPPLGARAPPRAAAGGPSPLYAPSRGNVPGLPPPPLGKVNKFPVQKGP